MNFYQTTYGSKLKKMNVLQGRKLIPRFYKYLHYLYYCFFGLARYAILIVPSHIEKKLFSLQRMYMNIVLMMNLCSKMLLYLWLCCFSFQITLTMKCMIITKLWILNWFSEWKPVKEDVQNCMPSKVVKISSELLKKEIDGLLRYHVECSKYIFCASFITFIAN